MVTAAADDIPPSLIEQLKPGGRLVMPVGPQQAAQNLVLLEKHEDGKIRSRKILAVAFVPLTGGN
jgi:protein-L-isoaspartate(D-aspartate) O-methyltransferase